MIFFNLIKRELREEKNKRSRAATRRYRERNQNLCRARVAEYQNTEKGKKIRKTWVNNNRQKRAVYDRRAALKRNYGITDMQYQEILKQQNGSCASCNDAPPVNHSRHSRLAVDHNHITGVIRGLLCAQCNLALGLLKEDIKRIEKLANYMKTKENSCLP